MMDDCIKHLGVDVVYNGNGLPAVNITILKFASDVEYETGDAKMVGENARFEIFIKDVERPLPGDTINIDGAVYQIYGEPLRNLDRKTWDVDAMVLP